MPQPERIVGDWGGPYVQAVYFSRRPPHPTEPDLFRDVVYALPHHPDNDTSQSVWLNLLFTPGPQGGASQVEVFRADPNGPAALVASTDVRFGTDMTLSLVIVPVSMPLQIAGQHWFEVVLDHRLLTKLSLRVGRATPNDPRARWTEVRLDDQMNS